MNEIVIRHISIQFNTLYQFKLLTRLALSVLTEVNVEQGLANDISGSTDLYSIILQNLKVRCVCSVYHNHYEASNNIAKRSSNKQRLPWTQS